MQPGRGMIQMLGLQPPKPWTSHCRKSVSVICMLMGISTSAHFTSSPVTAQTTMPGGQSAQQAGDMGFVPASGGEGIPLLGAPLAAPGSGLEGPVSGSYILGPGDVLTLSILGPEPLQHRLVVTLEGSVIIPGVAELSVDNLHLEEARQRVVAAVLAQYRNVEVSVSLAQLRRFQVHVLGQVARPGTYLASAVDRVSSAVNWAGGLTENASQRRILIIQGNTTRADADLRRFFSLGDVSANPHMRDGDIVYVPFSHDRIHVMGAVSEPLSFEFNQGDRLSHALAFSGWLMPEAYKDTIQVVRYSELGGDPFRFFAVAGGGLLPAVADEAGLLPDPAGFFGLPKATDDCPDILFTDFELQAEDLVIARAIPDHRLRRMVEIDGEVVFPGQYPISEGRTTLLDVIGWAGGITTNAFLTEATLTRRKDIQLEDREFERLRVIPPSEMTRDEYDYFKLRSRERQGLMVVDFIGLLQEKNPANDIILEYDDLITIPSRRDFVKVLGLAATPGNVPYRPGLTPSDYIRLAGGYSERADRRRTRIIRAATGEWVSMGKLDQVGPGDTIWIPEKTDRQYWAAFKEVITITTQLLTIYIVIDRAFD